MATRYYQVIHDAIRRYDRHHLISGGRCEATAPLPDDPAQYAATPEALRENPACVGFHLCGAYLRNRARNRGLRGPDETPGRDSIAGITAANRATQAWARKAS